MRHGKRQLRSPTPRALFRICVMRSTPRSCTCTSLPDCAARRDGVQRRRSSERSTARVQASGWCKHCIATCDSPPRVQCSRPRSPDAGWDAEKGSSWLLPRIVGQGQALDLLLSGRHVDAAEALQIGRISRVLADGELLDHALAYSRELATRARRLLWRTQRHTERGLDHHLQRRPRIAPRRSGACPVTGRLLRGHHGPA